MILRENIPGKGRVVCVSLPRENVHETEIYTKLDPGFTHKLLQQMFRRRWPFQCKALLFYRFFLRFGFLLSCIVLHISSPPWPLEFPWVYYFVPSLLSLFK